MFAAKHETELRTIASGGMIRERILPALNARANTRFKA
jgi:hypothetical protein